MHKSDSYQQLWYISHQIKFRHTLKTKITKAQLCICNTFTFTHSSNSCFVNHSTFLLTLLTETYSDGSNCKCWECQWVLCLADGETLKESKCLQRGKGAGGKGWGLFFRRYEVFFLCFVKILCINCWACQSSTLYASCNISFLWGFFWPIWLSMT